MADSCKLDWTEKVSHSQCQSEKKCLFLLVQKVKSCEENVISMKPFGVVC